MLSFRLTEDLTLIPVFNMSVEFNSIYENNNLKNIFSQFIENDKLVHAFILEGAHGTGKMTFAKEIVKAVCCTSSVRPCSVCESCRKIDSMSAQDVSYYDIPEDKSEITVDTVREIRENSCLIPIEGEYKFFIIDNAQAMNVNAQNAFLKILEEPPQYVYFILLCTNSSILLPTVRSRAPVFRMQSIDIGIIDRILMNDFPSASEVKHKDLSLYEHILHSCGGSLGYCIDRLNSNEDENDFDIYTVSKEFFEILSKKDRIKFVLYSSQIPSVRNEFNRLLTYIRCGLRDVAAYIKANDSQLVYFNNDDEILFDLSSFDITFILKLINYTESALQSNDMNSNINIIKADYLSKIGALCRD